MPRAVRLYSRDGDFITQKELPGTWVELPGAVLYEGTWYALGDGSARYYETTIHTFAPEPLDEEE